MLFGEAEMNSYVVIMAIVTTVGALGTAGINAWLGVKKMVYDNKLALMEQKLVTLAAENDERKAETRNCHDERDRDRESHEREIDQLWQMVGDRRGQREGDYQGPERRAGT